jgi:hypothetical protein
MTITPPAAGTELTAAWTLTALANNAADIGTWTITLKATLQNYPTITATSIITSAVVLDPCAASIINTASITTPLTYQILYT